MPNLIITKAVLRKGESYQELRAAGYFVANIWGEVTSVEAPRDKNDTYMVTIGKSTAFLHVDEVEWEKEEAPAKGVPNK